MELITDTNFIGTAAIEI